MHAALVRMDSVLLELPYKQKASGTGTCSAPGVLLCSLPACRTAQVRAWPRIVLFVFLPGQTSCCSGLCLAGKEERKERRKEKEEQEKRNK